VQQLSDPSPQLLIPAPDVAQLGGIDLGDAASGSPGGATMFAGAASGDTVEGA
jgi:hypothetical protein